MTDTDQTQPTTDPYTLRREQTIRISAMHAALTVQSADKTIDANGVIDIADRIAAWMTTGERIASS